LYLPVAESKNTQLFVISTAMTALCDFQQLRELNGFSPVVPKVGGTALLGAVKQKWAIGGR